MENHHVVDDDVAGGDDRDEHKHNGDERAQHCFDVFLFFEVGKTYTEYC